MSTATLSVFFAVLCLVCWAGVVTIAVLAVAARGRPDSSAAITLEGLSDVALWLGWLVAAVTTLGSLYYSLVAHFEPCELCWYQRICAYPLSAILLVAALRRDRRVLVYVLPLTVVGAVIAMYHMQLQAFPAQLSFCSTLNPCTTRYVWEFGFVSLPFEALACFCFVTAMVLVARYVSADDEFAEDAEDDDVDAVEPHQRVGVS
jgi:disulfide bond formation protein DsbB